MDKYFKTNKIVNFRVLFQTMLYFKADVSKNYFIFFFAYNLVIFCIYLLLHRPHLVLSSYCVFLCRQKII